MGLVSCPFEVFDHSEEVGGLDGESGKVFQVAERGEVGPAVREIRELNDLVFRWRQISLHDPSEVGVNQAGHGNLALPGDAEGHQERFGEG